MRHIRQQGLEIVLDERHDDENPESLMIIQVEETVGWIGELTDSTYRQPQSP